eukprot:15463114-Alexandrium_andersonii.AAC.1
MLGWGGTPAREAFVDRFGICARTVQWAPPQSFGDQIRGYFREPRSSSFERLEKYVARSGACRRNP